MRALVVAATGAGPDALGSARYRTVGCQPDRQRRRRRHLPRFRVERRDRHAPSTARAVILATPAFVTATLLRDLRRGAGAAVRRDPLRVDAAVALAFDRERSRIR